MPLRLILGLCGAALLLSGCSQNWGSDETVIFVADENTPSPQQLCQVTALAEERESAIDTVRGAETAGSERGRTFLAEKLGAYEAKMEIAYRGMVSSCQLYANCLDRAGGAENLCVRSEISYNDSRQQFYDLAADADRLAAEVELTRLKAKAAAAKKRRHEPAQPTCAASGCAPRGSCKKVCETTAKIFTDNCCPLDDE